MPLSTVSGLLTRIGMGKLGRMGLEPAQRYQRARPGELIHIDVKKLGRIQNGYGKRITGSGDATTTSDKQMPPAVSICWSAGSSCTSALTTRPAWPTSRSLPTRKTTAVGFLRRAVKHFASYGSHVQRLITDNGSAYRSTIHAIACRTLRIRHLRTRPYRPQTNGKAERFIRTMLGSWAYGAIYRSSDERTAALDGWLHHYNHLRPHSALSHRPPIARLNELNNLLGSYT
jgi:hypothetical protein